MSESLAALPLITYRRGPDGSKSRATDHPLFGLLHDQPNSYQTSMEFREMLQAHAMLRGNGYALIVPGSRGFADQLLPIHPDRIVKIERRDDRRLWYEVRHDDGRSTFLEQDEVFHLKGLSTDGVAGVSILTLARDSIGLAIALEQYGSRVFSQGFNARGLLKHPGKLGQEAHNRLRDSFNRVVSGVSGAFKVPVLEEGMDYVGLGMTSDDAQFLQTRAFEAIDVARWFRVPPHKIGILDHATFSNIEEQNIDWATDTLQPWAVRWEQAIGASLLLERDRRSYFVEHLMDGLVRGISRLGTRPTPLPEPGGG